MGISGRRLSIILLLVYCNSWSQSCYCIKVNKFLERYKAEKRLCSVVLLRFLKGKKMMLICKMDIRISNLCHNTMEKWRCQFLSGTVSYKISDSCVWIPSENRHIVKIIMHCGHFSYINVMYPYLLLYMYSVMF